MKEIIKFREMLFSIVRRDLRSRYKGSFLGFLWTYINPLLQLVVYSIVFPYILKVSQANYSMFLFVALLPWIFFSTSIQSATTSIVAGGNLVKKIYFPRLLLPLAAVCTNLMNFIYGLVIIFIALFFTGIDLSYNVLWLPIIILIEFIFTFGLSLIFSSSYVKFRDLEHIVNVLTFIWFYLTPIVFPISIFPDKMMKFIEWNPMVTIINSYRDILMNGKQPEWNSLLYALTLGLILVVFGLFFFQKSSKTFAEDL